MPDELFSALARAAAGWFSQILIMSNLLIGLLGVLVATNQPAAVSNFVAKTTGISVPAHVRNTNDPVEMELTRIMEQDEAAQN